MNGSLSKYRIVAELGRGGMGTVHLAIARGPAGFNKLVVIKQLNRNFAEDPHFTAMFLEEARLAARLQHPKIVQTNEIVSDQGGYFIVMEYLEGVSLWRLIRRLRTHADARTQHAEEVRSSYMRAIVDVLAALEYAHALKDFDGRPLQIVHRDVSPVNVVVKYDGQVKLIDFGIAKATDTSDQTRAGILKGKIHYLSPEAVAGDPIDRRTDVFAAGAMLWDALAGQRLWQGMHVADIERALLRGAIPTPRSVDRDVSAELEAICMKALAPRPDHRYPDAASFRTDLERAIGPDGSSAESLAAAMSSEFLEERQRMRARLAEHLRDGGMSTRDADAGFSSGHVVIVPLASRGAGVSSDACTAPEIVVEERLSSPAPRRRRIALLGASTGVGAAMAVLLALATALAMRSSAEATLSEPAASLPPPAVESAAMEATPILGLVSPARPVATGASTNRPTRRRVAVKPHVSSFAASFGSSFDPPSLRKGQSGDLTEPPAVADPILATVATASPRILDDPRPAPLARTSAHALRAPAVSGGAVTRSEQNAVIESHGPEIESCWSRARMEQPFLDARVAISATVASDGHVSDVTSSASEPGTARLQACMRSAVQGWSFARPTGGGTGRVALVFE